MSILYPGSTPEFRILKKQDGSQIFQVRYLNETHRYVSRWQDVQVIEEKANDNTSKPTT